VEALAKGDYSPSLQSGNVNPDNAQLQSSSMYRTAVPPTHPSHNMIWPPVVVRTRRVRADQATLAMLALAQPDGIFTGIQSGL